MRGDVQKELVWTGAPLVIDKRSRVRGDVQKELVWTGAPLNTPRSPFTSD